MAKGEVSTFCGNLFGDACSVEVKVKKPRPKGRGFLGSI
jgi:hypothetical protein